jgi:hypothetical protein
MRRWNANYLTHQQLQSALAEANPVQIVLFSKIKVPSVVEDAQYSSTRALERAASTRSTQAIGTVAHSIANNVWSTEMLHGVHEALINQKGCWQEAQPTMTQESSLSSDHPTNKKTTTETKPSSSSFARDLLGALDNNDDHHHKQKKKFQTSKCTIVGYVFGIPILFGSKGGRISTNTNGYLLVRSQWDSFGVFRVFFSGQVFGFALAHNDDGRRS